MNKSAQFVFLPNNNFERRSELFIDSTGKMIFVPVKTNVEWNDVAYQHLYILSDDEIKLGTWVINLENNEVYKSKGNIPAGLSNKECLIKKIIATTDFELHKNCNVCDKKVLNGENSICCGEKTGVDNISQSDIERCINIYNEKNKIKCWNCGAEKKVLTGMCSACGRFHVDVKETDANLENRKIVAAQQYALKNCQDNMGSLTKVKLAWENGFETAQSLEGNADKKFTLDEMRKAFNEGMLLPNSQIGSSDTVFQQVIQSISKEQPKSDTVLVEYEEIFPSYQHGRGLYIDYKPKLDKDGNIVIVKK